MAKRVLFFIVGSAYYPVAPHVPDNGERAPQENQLHYSVVQGDKTSKDVQVPSSKNKSIELLGFQRNPCIEKKKVIKSVAMKAYLTRKKVHSKERFNSEHIIGQQYLQIHRRIIKEWKVCGAYILENIFITCKFCRFIIQPMSAEKKN